MNHLLKLESDLNEMQAERDKYKARYEYLESLCCIGLYSEKYDWCELRGRATVIVEKNCDTICEAVDFVLGGNGV